MTDYKSTMHPHKGGHEVIYSAVNTDNKAIVDVYNDQYFVNWSTRLKAIDFVRLWRRYDYMDKATVRMTPSPSPELDTGNGLLDLVDDGEMDDFHTGLIRIWFSGVSVAWQTLPEHFGWTPIVGFASDVVDVEFFNRYFKETATTTLLSMKDAIESTVRKLSFRDTTDLVMAFEERAEGGDSS